MRHVELTVPVADAELAADRLWTAGAAAVEERPAGELTTLRSVLAQDDEVSVTRLGDLPAGWSVAVIDVDDAPSEAWREVALPVEINSELVLRPAWLPASGAPGLTEIAIEPGASFGLGDHPSTRLAAHAAWRLTRAGDRVLDVGCGSGALGIVAAMRGASSVVAIDIAEAASEATHANAVRNGVRDRFDIGTTPLDRVNGEYDLVLANILAPVLVGLAPDLRRLTAPNGHLVIAGVLVNRWDHVAAALEPMAVCDARQSGEWAAVVFSHP